MNEIYFWHRKSSYQMQIYLIVSILTYLVSRNLYLKSKFILSTFRSPLLSNYPSVTKKKIHWTVKICSVFVVKWNWQLSDAFVLIAEQQQKKEEEELHRLEMILSLKGKLLVITFIVVMVIKLLCISWKLTVIYRWFCFVYNHKIGIRDSITVSRIQRNWHLIRKTFSIQVPRDRVMQILQEENSEK